MYSNDETCWVYPKTSVGFQLLSHVLFQDICIADDHVSENDLWNPAERKNHINYVLDLK